MLDLAALQKLFHSLATAPEGVDKGLAQLGLHAADLEAVVAGDERLSAVERLDIYANMYFFRLLDVLREDFPKLASVVSEADFHNLITDYLLACPPNDASIAQAGARLPGFVATHALSAERPWLAELALLERRRVEVFDAPDREALTLERLRAMAPDEFAALPVALVPAHALVETQFAVGAWWRALDEGEQPSVPDRAPSTIIVWRQEPSLVFHRALEDDEQSLLPLVHDAAPFGLVCERLAEGRAMEAATQRAFELLARWVSEGLLAVTTGALPA